MKRILSIAIILLLLLSSFGAAATAAQPEPVLPAESAYLSHYRAGVTTSDTRGAILLEFWVGAEIMKPTIIGVSEISVCRYDGTPMKTINGSYANGLLTSGVYNYLHQYLIDGLEPGTNYYAKVTVIVGDAKGSDTRQITTNTTKAGS